MNQAYFWRGESMVLARVKILPQPENWTELDGFPLTRVAAGAIMLSLL